LARLNTFTLGAGLPLRIAGTLAFGIEGAALTSSIVYVGQALAGARLLLGRPHPNG
jgi:hypothetical protein